MLDKGAGVAVNGHNPPYTMPSWWPRVKKISYGLSFFYLKFSKLVVFFTFCSVYYVYCITGMRYVPVVVYGRAANTRYPPESFSF